MFETKSKLDLKKDQLLRIFTKTEHFKKMDLMMFATYNLMLTANTKNAYHVLEINRFWLCLENSATCSF